EADRLDAARHLDGAHRVADIDHVRGIAAGSERLLALDERELAAAVAVADAVGRGRDRPLALQERAAPLLSEAVVAQAHVDAQLHLFRKRRPEPLLDGAPCRELASTADRQHVAFADGAALEASDHAERV